MRIVVLTDKLDVNEPNQTFVAFIDNGTLWLDGHDIRLSRTHHQFNRIYSAKGIHPTLSASEMSGRYYVCEIIDEM